MKDAKMNRNGEVWAGTEAGTQTSPETALDHLQSIYRNPMEATSVRIRAAVECLPFESPKFTAVAVGHFQEGTFAELLDRAIERSRAPLLIEASPLPPAAQHPPEELKGTFAKPRKGLRRF